MELATGALLVEFFTLAYAVSLVACFVFIVKIRRDYQSQNGKIVHKALIIRDGIFIIVTFAVGIVALMLLLKQF